MFPIFLCFFFFFPDQFGCMFFFIILTTFLLAKFWLYYITKILVITYIELFGAVNRVFEVLIFVAFISSECRFVQVLLLCYYFVLHPQPANISQPSWKIHQINLNLAHYQSIILQVQWIVTRLCS